MVILNRIYTRTGDAGTTALGDGRRVEKHGSRVSACGAVDETNAALGVARSHAAGDREMDAMLARIQNDLFDLGADLCRPPEKNKSEKNKKDNDGLRVSDGQVAWLEEKIDSLNGSLEPLRSFVLPGGTALAAHLHLARTLARRAERSMTQLATTESVGGPALRYVNRLSDLLFVASRVANNQGRDDVLWVPGENR